MRRLTVAAVAAVLTGCASARVQVLPIEQIGVRASVSTQVSGAFEYFHDEANYHGGHIGRIAVEVPLIVTRELAVTSALEHSSLLDTDKDRGEERLSIGLQWRPFAN